MARRKNLEIRKQFIIDWCEFVEKNNRIPTIIETMVFCKKSNKMAQQLTKELVGKEIKYKIHIYLPYSI